jgi:hypothetical protein
VKCTGGLDDPLAVRLGAVALASPEGDALGHGELLREGEREERERSRGSCEVGVSRGGYSGSRRGS